MVNNNQELQFDISIEEIGKHVKYKREQMGLSQRSLARRANVDYRVIQAIEENPNSKPTLVCVARVARALDISMDNLINGCLIDIDCNDKEIEFVRYSYNLITVKIGLHSISFELNEKEADNNINIMERLQKYWNTITNMLNSI